MAESKKELPTTTEIDLVEDAAKARELFSEPEQLRDYDLAARVRMAPVHHRAYRDSDSLRGRSVGMEALLQRKIPIVGIPGGFHVVIDYMGTDMSIIEAARASFGKGHTARIRSRAMNMRLAKYLLDHGHGTPLEVGSVRLVTRVPMAVFGHIVRYRAGSSLNVTSTRYTEHDVADDTAFYVPEAEQLRAQSDTAKQCSGDLLPPELAGELHQKMIECLGHIAETYRYLPDHGLSREQARFLLPDARMVTFSWTVNLRAMLHICRQRLDGGAMPETQAMAAGLFYIIRVWLPDTYQALMATAQFIPSLDREELKRMKRLHTIQVGIPGPVGGIDGEE